MADRAKKQGRKVFAILGPIHSSNSKGPNYLIKQGANLVKNANNILEELNLPFQSKSKEISGETSEENLILETLKEEDLYVDKIVEKTKLNVATVSSILAILEIKGKVINLGGNIYAISHC